jgi:hypothetical protein
MQNLLSALAEAQRVNAISASQLESVYKALGIAPATNSVPVADVAPHTIPEPPQRDCNSVSLPPSFFVAARLSPRINRNDILAALSDKHNGLSWAKIDKLRLTCKDLYHLGCTAHELPRVTKAVLLGGKVSLSDLCQYFQITREQLLEYSEYSPANLLACVRSAEECALVGITADWLLAINVNPDFLVQLPFDAAAAAKHLGLQRKHILKLQLSSRHCAQPGWSYSDVRKACCLSDADMRALGIDLQSMLQNVQTIR